MTNDENLALLQALSDTHPFLTKERTLFADMNNRLKSPITYDAFRSLLQTMKEKRRVQQVVHPEDGNKYKITDEGFARLQELE